MPQRYLRLGLYVCSGMLADNNLLTTCPLMELAQSSTINLLDNLERLEFELMAYHDQLKYFDQFPL